MRGLHCDGRSIRLRRDLQDPAPKSNRFQTVRVSFAGICDTDLQLARGYMGYQGILGHEFVGTLSDGRRVTAEINNSCRVCPVCLNGRPNHCPARTVIGIVGHDGAMADHVLVQTDNIHFVPDTIDDSEAVFIEPLAAAFRVPEQVPFGPESSLAVLGDGKLGILCAWVARLHGAKVSLIGKHAAKLALSGADIATHLLDEISALRRRFDVVIDVTGSASGLATALTLVQPGGTIVLKTTVAADHALNLAPVVVDEVRVVGSRCGPFPTAIRALAERQINVRPLIESVYSLDDAELAFEAASRKGAKKVLLRI
jgi:threonine dehydrogenase-like Zn-dependent dehydrogenase